MAFTLPPLPYALDAMEPHIDSKTMEIHHGKHHQAYITNLNKAIEGTPLESNHAVPRFAFDTHRSADHVRSMPFFVRVCRRGDRGRLPHRGRPAAPDRHRQRPRYPGKGLRDLSVRRRRGIPPPRHHPWPPPCRSRRPRRRPLRRARRRRGNSPRG